MSASPVNFSRLALLVLAAGIWHTAAPAASVFRSGTGTNAGGAYRASISFSDPSRPGTVHLAIVSGGILVKGGDGNKVIISARPGHSLAQVRQPSPQPVFTAAEQDNRLSILSSSSNSPVEFQIAVPRRTNLQLSTETGGDIVVDAVDGDLELGNVNGSIILTDVAGSVVAHTINGKVNVTMTRVNPQQPVSFSSLNGTIDVTLPTMVRANIKLRSDRGRIFTDFNTIVPEQRAPTLNSARRSVGLHPIDADNGIYASLNGGGQDIELRTFNGDIYLRKGSAIGYRSSPRAADGQTSGAIQSAVWTRRELRAFLASGLPVGTCDWLVDELRSVLRQLGARPSDLYVGERGVPGCVQATFAVLTPSGRDTSASGSTVEARWQTVEIRLDVMPREDIHTGSRINPIVPLPWQQFLAWVVREKVLPLFPARGVEFNDDSSLRVQVLKAPINAVHANGQ